ncbi:hypothetical protein HWB05_gp002 [Streptomyces phage BRock]|uniref:Uncharacterized protein n=1 Tax=Streptomyces phage BRock TaxID=1913591 RepID=A0A1J0GVR0_9CAUD|nr:hypothetical protein HWB05_gp002 [Streptomyces phage BRock]APC46264.1 hypothetical protein [Streptomyces phage BRock]
MAITKAARKGGMVAHIMRDDVTSLCGRVMVVIPGGEGKRLCKSCARINGMVVTTEEFVFTDAEWEFIKTPRDAFSMFMVRDVLDDYAKTGDNDPRRIAIYNAIVEHHTMAATEIVVTNAPGGNRGGDGMVNRNSKSAAKRTGATENQRAALLRQGAFIDSLFAQLFEIQGTENPNPNVTVDGYTTEYFDGMTRATIDKEFKTNSALIDRLKLEIGKAKSEARKVESVTEKANVIEDGYYVYGDTFACVKFNRAGTRQYATVWDDECKSWEYDSRESAKVKSGILAGDVKRVTPEDAKRFGDLYGTCMKCSRTLTKPESIAAGIGPVCAGGMGW